MLHPKTTLNCRGKFVDLASPHVMGILNVTPDSFFDGGQHPTLSGQLRQVEKMLREGATFVDVGGMSSRPGAQPVALEEELRRTIPIIEAIGREFPGALVSIDTVRATVAKAAVEAGAHLINDISAGAFDPELYDTVAALGVPYVLMHMQGRPDTMQHSPRYDDVVQEVLDFFIRQVGKLRELGVKDIVLDPGFGFGKTVEHNYQLLARLHVFHILDLPVLAGISRKSMICKVLKINPERALNGSTALHMVALQQGAKILRVHDVREAREVIALWQQLGNSSDRS